MNWQNIFLVILGSGFGGSLRYLISHFHGQLTEDPTRHFIPIILVNVIGSLLIGFAFAILIRENLNDKAALFLITGLLGGFTTYSSFSLDILRLIQRGEFITALLYVCMSLVLGLAAVALGFWLGKLIYN